MSHRRRGCAGLLPFPTGARLGETVSIDGSVEYLMTAAGCLIAVAGLVVAALAIRKARRDVERTKRARSRRPFR